MKSPPRFLLAVFILILPRCAIWGLTLHVSPDGDGSNGTTWTTAFPTIGQAIEAASSGDIVWIREGTYPELLQLKSGLSILGGFEGDETEDDFEVRDSKSNPTILDPNELEGSVLSFNEVHDVTIESLTITGGKALHGAGVHILDSSNVFLSHCDISGNVATNDLSTPPNPFVNTRGGGVLIESSSFEINDST